MECAGLPALPRREISRAQGNYLQDRWTILPCARFEKRRQAAALHTLRESAYRTLNSLACVHKPWCISLRKLRYAKASLNLLANLEHEFRIFRHPIWLGSADGQHELDLSVSWRKGIRNCGAMAGGAADGFARSAAHRLRQ